MENNCLVTQLKGTVSGNFEKLGNIMIPLQDNTSGKIEVEMIRGISGVISTIGDAVIATSIADLDNNPQSSVSVINGFEYYVRGNEGSCLDISEKYNILRLRFNFIVNSDKLKYLTSLQELYAGKCKGRIEDLASNVNLKNLYLYNSTELGGSINSLSQFTQLRMLNVQYTKVHGDISALSNNISITTINVQNTNVDGSIEDFATKMITAGRTSGRINISSSFVTYQGNVIKGDKYVNFSDGSYTVTDN